MCLRYSSRVVAPIMCSSPRANAGLRILAASIEPSEAPAPTSRCNSSIKRIILPCFLTSAITFFSRSSNSPRYLVPAIIAAISSITTRRSNRWPGTSSRTIRCASPSTIAVLPTPGSPIKTGLFLVRRLRIVIIRSSSLSRPIIGSSSPLAARAVKSTPKALSAPPRVLPRRRGSVAISPCSPRFSSNDFSSSLIIISTLMPISRSSAVARALPCRRTLYNICSVPR